MMKTDDFPGSKGPVFLVVGFDFIRKAWDELSFTNLFVYATIRTGNSMLISFLKAISE